MLSYCKNGGRYLRFHVDIRGLKNVRAHQIQTSPPPPPLPLPSGAISTFIGVTRDNFQGKKVVLLEYDAYAPMALAKMLVSADEGRG
jgi:molybdopterin synthase catalytic subunit